MTRPHPRPVASRIRRPAIVVGLLLLALAGPLAGCSGDDDDSAAAPGPTEVAFATRTGAEATLSSYAGQPLVVNFFAAWCAPCVEEMPDIEAVHHQFGDQVAFLGLSIDADAADGWELADAAGVTYDLGHDDGSVLFHELGGVGMPTTVLVAPDGTIADLHSGALSSDDLGEMISTTFGI